MKVLVECCRIEAIHTPKQEDENTFLDVLYLRGDKGRRQPRKGEVDKAGQSCLCVWGKRQYENVS